MSKPETHALLKNESVQPLPCRGCQKSCVNVAQCEGKLWRMKDSVVRRP
jgi:hypothetical protein